MKINKTCLFYAFMGITMIIILGCQKPESIVNSSPDHSKLQKSVAPSKPSELPRISFGIFPLNGNPNRITYSGPDGYGYKGIILYTGYDNRVADSLDFKAARDAGYNPIVAYLQREAIVLSQWSKIREQVKFGKEKGAHWFYVDDAMSNEQIDKGQINMVSSIVHTYPAGQPSKPLATAEWSMQKMQSDMTWHDAVDIIMPYRYQLNKSDLRNFIKFVYDNYYLTKGKRLVPFLGYHAIAEGGQYYNQTGIYGTGHIEYIRPYLTNNFIFYYISDPVDDYLDEMLTPYLHAYYHL
jgi:hypothetical protein